MLNQKFDDQGKYQTLEFQRSISNLAKFIPSVTAAGSSGPFEKNMPSV